METPGGWVKLPMNLPGGRTRYESYTSYDVWYHPGTKVLTQIDIYIYIYYIYLYIYIHIYIYIQYIYIHIQYIYILYYIHLYIHM